MSWTFNPFTETFDNTDKDESQGVCVTHLLSSDLTVDAGTTCIHASTEIADGVTLEISDGGVFYIVD